ncbi:hypothetical protein BT67DRAFT_441687 [Trichocladium antarcticum]|uniref:Uncharacterized protein n=1 Tax=Trichocladium antarcticum TaxID=1450529 RepID=A0AAN6ZCY8_9PEZI|nr:hypothetical protein BT67DRAFT_441687 [Trichocladium antarcticum]
MDSEIGCATGVPWPVRGVCVRPKSRPNFNGNQNFVMNDTPTVELSATHKLYPSRPPMAFCLDAQPRTVPKSLGQWHGEEQNSNCNIRSLPLSSDRPPPASFLGTLIELDINRGDTTYHAPTVRHVVRLRTDIVPIDWQQTSNTIGYFTGRSQRLGCRGLSFATSRSMVIIIKPHGWDVNASLRISCLGSATSRTVAFVWTVEEKQGRRFRRLVGGRVELRIGLGQN